MTAQAARQTYLRDPVVRACLILILFGAGGFGWWGATAQLAQGVAAMGTVVVENRRIPIQHQDGGIIEQIDLREGASVRAGHRAMVIGDTALAGRLAQARAERLGRLGRLDRLDALLTQAPTMESPRLAPYEQDPQVPEIIAVNRALWADQHAALAGERALVLARIDSLAARRDVLDVRRAGKLREIAALRDEHALQEQALTRQLGNISRVNDLLREIAVGETQLAEIAQEGKLISASVAEAQLELQQVDLTARAKTSADYSQTLEEAASLTREIAVLAAREQRGHITVPVDGTVIDVAFSAAGGVVAPGERLFDLVPEDAALQVEVKFRPGDRDDLTSGRPVNLRFGTLDAIAPPEMQGQLITIAADATPDKQTGEPYYLGMVSLSEDETARETLAQLTPGIPVEVFFDKGTSQTPLSYFTQPLSDMLRRGMRS